MREETPKSKIETANLLLTLGLKDAAVEQLYMAADLYEKKNEVHEALKIYKKILEIKPEEKFAKKRVEEIEGKKEPVFSESQKIDTQSFEVSGETLVETKPAKKMEKPQEIELDVKSLYRFIDEYEDCKKRRVDVIQFLSSLGMYDLAEKEIRSLVIAFPDRDSFEFAKKMLEAQGRDFFKFMEELAQSNYPEGIVSKILSYLEKIYAEKGMQDRLQELKKNKSSQGNIQFI